MTESRTLNCKNLSCFSHDLPAHRIFKDTGIESYRFLFFCIYVLSNLGKIFFVQKGDGWNNKYASSTKKENMNSPHKCSKEPIRKCTVTPIINIAT